MFFDFVIDSMDQISLVTNEPTIVPVKTITVTASHPEIPSPSSTSSSFAAQNNSRNYCVYKGRKYAINERFEDGCESICKCMASNASVECEPRCPKHNQTTATREQCVSVADPKDSCCRIELCDVTLDDHEQGAISIVPAPPSLVDAMKHRNAPHTSRTSNELNLNHNNNNNTHKALVSSVTSAAFDADAAGNEHNSNEKYDCEHKGSKYKIGNNWHKEAHEHTYRLHTSVKAVYTAALMTT